MITELRALLDRRQKKASKSFIRFGPVSRAKVESGKFLFSSVPRKVLRKWKIFETVWSKKVVEKWLKTDNLFFSQFLLVLPLKSDSTV